MGKQLHLVLGLVLCACLAIGCAPKKNSSRRPLRVFAASSLTDAFLALETDFELRFPDVDLQFNFAGSQVLRLQIEQGAAADLFASADATQVQALVDAKLALPSQNFAQNRLVVISHSERQPALSQFAELAHLPRIVLGSDEVPVGRYSQELLQKAEGYIGVDWVESLRDRVVSRENNVRFVRSKVELGEADAAIVYASDAHRRPALRVLELPKELQVDVQYPMTQLRNSPQAPLAAQFTKYLLGPAGQSVLRDHGFRAKLP